MALPEAVQRQSDAADAMIKQEAEKTVTTDLQEPTAVVESAEPAVPTVSTEPVEPQPVVASPTTDYKALYESLVAQVGDQPYKVLQGKYNAEVPRMAAEIRRLNAEIQQLRSMPQSSQPPAGGESLTKMRQDYGDEFVEQLVGIVRAELSQGLAPVVETVKKSEKDSYLDRLTALVPTWQTLMNDPAFNAFLDEFDQFSGRTLRDMAIEADAAGDANRVAKFYQSFLSRSQAPQPATPSPTTPQDRREALVAPAAQKGQPSAPATAGPKYYTAKEIQRFHNEVALGKWRDRPEDLKKITAEYDLAIREGRITAG